MCYRSIWLWDEWYVSYCSILFLFLLFTFFFFCFVLFCLNVTRLSSSLIFFCQRDLRLFNVVADRLIRNFRGTVRNMRIPLYHVRLSNQTYHVMSSIWVLFLIHPCVVQIFLICVDIVPFLFPLARAICARLMMSVQAVKIHL